MASAESGLFHEEMTLSDETFRYFLRSSVLVQLFSLLENLFLEVAKGIKGDRLLFPIVIARGLLPGRCLTCLNCLT